MRTTSRRIKGIPSRLLRCNVVRFEFFQVGVSLMLQSEKEKEEEEENARRDSGYHTAAPVRISFSACIDC